MEIHISLVGRKDLAGEIYCQLRAAIATGKLRVGEALPSTRELASRLSVSRGTVATAYDRLSGEGFVTSHVGAGTFVSEWAVRGDPQAVISLERPEDRLGVVHEGVFAVRRLHDDDLAVLHGEPAPA